MTLCKNKPPGSLNNSTIEVSSSPERSMTPQSQITALSVYSKVFSANLKKTCSKFKFPLTKILSSSCLPLPITATPSHIFFSKRLSSPLHLLASSIDQSWKQESAKSSCLVGLYFFGVCLKTNSFCLNPFVKKFDLRRY